MAYKLEFTYRARRDDEPKSASLEINDWQFAQRLDQAYASKDFKALQDCISKARQVAFMYIALVEPSAPRSPIIDSLELNHYA